MTQDPSFDFFNHIQESILVINQDYQILDVNQTFLTVVKRRREEVLGKTCYQIIYRYRHPCRFSGQLCPLKKVFRTGKPERCFHTLDSQNGSRKHLDLLFSPVLDSKGKVTRVIEAVRETRDTGQMEEALRESEQRFRSIVENSFTGILMVDNEYQIIYANEQLGRILGRSPA